MLERIYLNDESFMVNYNNFTCIFLRIPNETRRLILLEILRKHWFYWEVLNFKISWKGDSEDFLKEGQEKREIPCCMFRVFYIFMFLELDLSRKWGVTKIQE